MIAEKFYTIADTSYGPVRGIKKFTAYGDEYFSFQKIPYMKPPVGQLRFKNAESPEPWTTPLDATVEGPSFHCRDFISGRVTGQLDAMFINIYTKDIKPEKLKPVMVFIHGGGFFSGSGGTDCYGPDYLIQEDVILVTFNYRLGIFGFLSLSDESLGVPGNSGLKDQNFALKWIKSNIKNFGGDPENITVFGESAGAYAVHFHTISELSKNLFKRAIMMSGSALSKKFPTSNVESAFKLALKLGWDGKGGEKGLLSFLENTDESDILQAFEVLYKSKEIKAFIPIIEPYITDNTFIAEDPLLLARKAWGNDIDIIVGATTLESVFMLKFNPALEEFVTSKTNFLDLLTESLQLKNPDKAQYYATVLKQIYCGNEDSSHGFLEFFSDYLFFYGIYRTTLVRNNSGGLGRTYLYKFNYDIDKMNFGKTLFDFQKFEGSTHFDDISYIFKTSYLPAPLPGSEGYDAMMKMISLYTSFARNGDLSGKNTKLNIDFKVCEGKKLPINIFKISKEFENSELPQCQKFSIWDSIYEEENLSVF